MRRPKFEIFAAEDGKFYYRLKAANGEPIMTGRGYSSKFSVLHGIAHVMENAIEEGRFTLKRSANHKFYFQLRSKSGRIIGWSELYESKQGRDNGVRAVMKAAQFGRVNDLGLLQAN
ncbi:MAG: YegP family protein [Bacteroidota bacterium]